jgi:hypothetical protein
LHIAKSFDLPVFVQIAFPRKNVYSYFLKEILSSCTMCAGDDKPSSSPWGIETNNEGLHHLAEHEVKGSSLVLYGYIKPSVPSEVQGPQWGTSPSAEQYEDKVVL